MWFILIPNEYFFLAHTHLAIKEPQIASKYLAIHDCQIAIVHLAMKERQIASNFFSQNILIPNEYNFRLILNSYVCMIRQLFQNRIFC
jgi:hypothetical protein